MAIKYGFKLYHRLKYSLFNNFTSYGTEKLYKISYKRRRRKKILNRINAITFLKFSDSYKKTSKNFILHFLFFFLSSYACIILSFKTDIKRKLNRLNVFHILVQLIREILI